jgi:hypothetical protein
MGSERETDMIVTPDMPKEAGSTVEFSGKLQDLADIIGWDEVGAKVTTRDYQQCVKLEIDSFSYPHSTMYMDPDDAEALGKLLIEKAKIARA